MCAIAFLEENPSCEPFGGCILTFKAAFLALFCPMQPVEIQIEDDRAFLLQATTQSPVSPLTRKLLTLVGFVATAGFLFGYHSAVVSGALIALKEEFHLNPSQQEFIVSSAVGVAILGASAASWLADRFGRKRTIMLSSAVFTSGSLLMAVCNSYSLLVLGRAVVGFGIGLASAVGPLYLAEVSPASHSSKIVTLNVLFITGGQFVSGLAAGAFSSQAGGWRLMFAFPAILSLLQFVGFLWLPESPQWLILKGKTVKASSALSEIRPSSDAHAVEAELKHMQDASCARPEDHLSIWRVLRASSLRPQLILGASLQFIQQFAGINAVMYYSGSILQGAGFSPADAIWLVALVAFVNFAFTVVSLLLVDRWGRRKLTLFSLGGVVLVLLYLGVVFFLQRRGSTLS